MVREYAISENLSRKTQEFNSEDYKYLSLENEAEEIKIDRQQRKFYETTESQLSNTQQGDWLMKQAQSVPFYMKHLFAEKEELIDVSIWPMEQLEQLMVEGVGEEFVRLMVQLKKYLGTLIEYIEDDEEVVIPMGTRQLMS